VDATAFGGKKVEIERLSIEAERKAAKAQVDARPEKEGGEIEAANLQLQQGSSRPRPSHFHQRWPSSREAGSHCREGFNNPIAYIEGALKPDRLYNMDKIKYSVIVTAYQKVLANAWMISDFNAVTYPEGVLGPSPTLNQNTREGKFR